jgi:homeobox protein cut-like
MSVLPTGKVCHHLRHYEREGENANYLYSSVETVQLTNKRDSLDQQGLTIAESQTETKNSRKLLGGKTKEFSKLEGEERVKAFGPLLKLYQQEVDTLTRRAQLSEGFFLQLYKTLYDAPDPVYALSAAADALKGVVDNKAVEAKNARLQQELEELTEEISDLRNQEVTIRLLEEKLKGFEDKMEAELQAKLDVEENSLLGSYKDAMQHAQEETMRMRKDLEVAESKLEEYLSAENIRQDSLLQAKKQLHALEAESTQALEQLEQENDQLRHDVARLKTTLSILETTEAKDKDKEKAAAVADGEEELLSSPSAGSGTQALRAEALKAQQLLLAVESKLAMTQQRLAAEEESHRLRMGELQDQLASLRREVSTRPTKAELEKLQRQLKIFMAIEYSATADMLEGDDDPENEALREEVSNVEHMLLRKNRQLESQLVGLRVRMKETDAKLQEKESDLEKKAQTCSEQAALIVKLEAELVEQEQQIGGEFRLASKVEDTGPSSKKQADMSGLFKEQRDRFRARILEMEQQLDRLESQNATLTTEKDRYYADNIALYERLRFLQHASSTSSRQQSRQSLETGRVEKKYEAIYEQSKNPFRDFSQKEEKRRESNLNIADRMTLHLSRFFLSSPTTRLVLFFYAMSLHALVFLTLYVVITWECPPQIAPAPVRSAAV